MVIHDRLVTPQILELARREATIVDMGKEGFGPSTPQAHIDAAIVAHAAQGAHVVRLKSGDATVFGRLDEEIDACTAAGIAFSIIPGRTGARLPPRARSPRSTWASARRASCKAA